MLLIIILQWQVFFSPNGGAEAAIIRTIDSAQKQILVQAYSFTSEPIATALVRAKHRGCDVRIILDKRQRTAHHSQWRLLAFHGIPVYFDTRVALHHNKVMIIDSATVITGSYNFTRSAEKRNAENLLVVRDTVLARYYLATSSF